jgi:hypothetical protein
MTAALIRGIGFAKAAAGIAGNVSVTVTPATSFARDGRNEFALSIGIKVSFSSPRIRLGSPQSSADLPFWDTPVGRHDHRQGKIERQGHDQDFTS